MKKIIILIFIVILMFGTNYKTVKASEETEYDDIIDTYEESIDFASIDESIENSISDKSSFKELFSKAINGEIEFDISYLLGYIGEIITSGVRENKAAFVQIIMLVSAAALLNNFTEIFKNAHLNEICFYIVYMILITIIIKAMTSITMIVSETLNELLDFMKALIPSYICVMTVTVGQTTSVFFYQIIMVIIFLIEWILMKFVLPVINIYVVLVLVNSISKTDFLSKMTELINTFVEWLLKFLMGAVISINILQGLITPVLDSMKKGIFSKAASAIPGIGNAINSVTKMIIGSGILIKNGIGVAALIIILIICMIPYTKLLIISAMYKIINAVIQPISDKRIVNGISGATDAMKLLSKVVLTSSVLFLVTIALITTATSTNYL